MLSAGLVKSADSQYVAVEINHVVLQSLSTLTTPSEAVGSVLLPLQSTRRVISPMTYVTEINCRTVKFSSVHS